MRVVVYKIMIDEFQVFAEEIVRTQNIEYITPDSMSIVINLITGALHASRANSAFVSCLYLLYSR